MSEPQADEVLGDLRNVDIRNYLATENQLIQDDNNDDDDDDMEDEEEDDGGYLYFNDFEIPAGFEFAEKPANFLRENEQCRFACCCASTTSTRTRARS